MKWILRKKSKATAIINEAMHHTHPSLLVHIDYRGTWIALAAFIYVTRQYGFTVPTTRVLRSSVGRALSLDSNIYLSV